MAHSHSLALALFGSFSIWLSFLVACGSSAAVPVTPDDTATEKAITNQIAPSVFSQYIDETIETYSQLRKGEAAVSGGLISEPLESPERIQFQDGFTPVSPVRWHAAHILAEVYLKKSKRKTVAVRFSIFITPKGQRVSTTELYPIRDLAKRKQALPAEITTSLDLLVSGHAEGTVPYGGVRAEDFPSDPVLGAHLQDSDDQQVDPKNQKVLASATSTLGHGIRAISVIGQDKDGTHFIVGGEIFTNETGKLAWKRQPARNTLTVVLLPIQTPDSWAKELQSVCALAEGVSSKKDFGNAVASAKSLRPETRAVFAGLGSYANMNYENVKLFSEEYGAPPGWKCKKLQDLLRD